MVSTDNEKEGIGICSQCGQVMDVSALRPYSNAVCPSCGESTRVNGQMGQYRIIDKIGIGGMSVVYRAHDTILGREVALKVLNEKYGLRSDRISKFEEEARLMARVNHGNIVKVYSVGSACGCFYIAMELVGSGDLETWLREHGPIPEKQVLLIAEQVVGGLEEAWRAGMLHRDIKPANILMDSSGTAKVVDFGLSLLGSPTTHEEEIWATPYYAPPETLMRRAEDSRSDMYALGCTLFQLLVGKPPFEEIPESVSAILEIKKNLPRLEKVAPEISAPTCRMINKLMAYAPGKRYGSYEELREDIHNAIARLEGKEGVPYEQRRTLIRRGLRTKGRLIAAVAAGGVALAGLFVWLALKPPAVDEPAVSASGDDARDLAGSVGAQENGTSTVNVGALFLEAENELKKGDAVAARNIFGKILDLNECPVSTYAWSALQSALCSWSIGSKYDGDLMLGRLRDFLEHAPEKEMTSGMRELQKLTGSLISKEVGNPPVLNSVNARLLFLVGNGMKNWELNDYKTILEGGAELEKLASEAKDGDVSAMARAWLDLLTPFLKDAAVLSRLEGMPETTEDEVLAKKNKISEEMDKRQSPGIAFRQMMALMENAANVSLADIKSRKTAPGIPGGSDSGNEPVIQDSVWDLEFKERYSEVVSEMEKTWNFDKTAKQLAAVMEEMKNPARKEAVKSLSEMAEHAASFLRETLSKVGRLPAKDRVFSGTDGKKALVLSVDDAGAKVQQEGGAVSTVAVSSLGADTLIELHRDIVSKLEKDPAAIAKRHEGAVAFLYLAGEIEKAEKAASVLMMDNADFAVRWEQWMQSLTAAAL